MNIYRGKKVVVTGHTGFKGSWLTQWLLNLGADVSGYSIDVPSQPSLYEALGLKKKIENKVADVAHLDTLVTFLKEKKPDCVFHLAAQAYVRKSYDEPIKTFETNMMGTVNILEAIRRTPSVQAAVIVTTDKCYLNRETGQNFNEEDKLGGDDPYSASKAAAEVAFHGYWKSFFGKEGAALATARAGNVIGGGDWSEDRLVPDCVKRWSLGQEVVLRSPQSVRPWQHVLDSLQGYLKLGEKLMLDRRNIDGESFNFGPEESSRKTVEELVRELQKTWPKAKVKVDSSTTGNKKESGYLFLDRSKAKNKLGWQPRYHFPESVEKTARWYVNFYESPSSAPTLVEADLKDFSLTTK